jgi:hypothetical protein
VSPKLSGLVTKSTLLSLVNLNAIPWSTAWRLVFTFGVHRLNSELPRVREVRLSRFLMCGVLAISAPVMHLLGTTAPRCVRRG